MLPDLLSSIVATVYSCIQSGTSLAFSAPVHRFARAFLLEADKCASVGTKQVSKLAVPRHPRHTTVAVDLSVFRCQASLR